MVKLSDEERRAWLEMARSEYIRNEFLALKACSKFSPDRPVDIDRFIQFLTAMNRLAPTPRRRFVEYRNVKL